MEVVGVLSDIMTIKINTLQLKSSSKIVTLYLKVDHFLSITFWASPSFHISGLTISSSALQSGIDKGYKPLDTDYKADPLAFETRFIRSGRCHFRDPPSFVPVSPPGFTIRRLAILSPQMNGYVIRLTT